MLFRKVLLYEHPKAMRSLPNRPLKKQHILPPTLLKLPSNTLRNQQLIRPLPSTQRRRLRQHITGIERARRPPQPARKHIRVLIQRR